MDPIKNPKILCLFSAPLVDQNGQPLDALDSEAERDLIIKELTACNREIGLRIRFATVEELAAGISERFNILHISGHGSNDSILFEDGASGSQEINGNYLKELIGIHNPFELAILSTCHSEPLAEMLFDAGIKHLIAIKSEFPIFDLAASVFIREFYRNLFRGNSIQNAFNLAKLLVKGNPKLAKIKPHLELLAKRKQIKFVPEHDKFVLIPDNPPIHKRSLFCSDIAKGELLVDLPKLSKTNLPSRPQSFTGRSKEMNHLINKILTNRIVTIVGAGGIGKSTIAIEVARWFHLREFFNDGILKIDLRQSEASMGLSEIIFGSLEKELGQDFCNMKSLENIQCLLLLDNLEELLWENECSVWDTINGILKSAPTIKLLVTSQRQIGGNLYESERVYRLDMLEMEKSVSLFILTANRAISEDELEMEDFKNLMLQLGGHPLSIVIMARQLVDGITFKELNDRINKNRAKAIKVKAIIERDKEHGESLIASLASAYNNLSENSKILFRVLSMLPAGATDFTIKKLINADAWEYAQELNEASLAEFYLNIQRRVFLLSPVRLFSLNMLNEDIKNEYGPKILDVMAKYAEEFFRNLSYKRARFYHFYFQIEEPNLRYAIELPYNPSEKANIPSSLGLLVPHLIYLYCYHYKYNEALKVGEISSPMFDKSDDKLGKANTYLAVGDVINRLGDFENAKSKFEKALEIFREIKYKLGEANSNLLLGLNMYITSQLYDAKDKYEGALKIYQNLNNEYGVANCKYHLGIVYIDLDKFNEAEKLLRSSADIFKKLDNRMEMASIEIALGDLNFRLFDYWDARSKFINGLNIYRKIHDEFGEARSLRRLGIIEIFMGNIEKAAEYLDHVIKIDNSVNLKLEKARTFLLLSLCNAFLGKLNDAQSMLDYSLIVFRENGYFEGLSFVFLIISLISLKKKNIPEAKKALENLQFLRKKISTYGEIIQWLLLFANHLKDCEYSNESKIYYEYIKTFSSRSRDDNLKGKVDQFLKQQQSRK